MRSAEGHRKACRRDDEVGNGALCTGGIRSRYLRTLTLAAEGEMHRRGHGGLRETVRRLEQGVWRVDCEAGVEGRERKVVHQEDML